MIRFSNMLCNVHKTDLSIVKQSSNALKRVIPHFDEDVLKNFNEGKVNWRNHSGLNRPAPVKFDHLLGAINIILENYPAKRQLLEDARLLCQYLRNRHRPITKSEYSLIKRKCINEVHDRMMKRDGTKSMDDDELDRIFSKKVKNLICSKVYNWRPINYTSYVGHQYLINRMPAEFAALNRIFLEISTRCPDFKPKSLLDFGSGVGTVTLAALNYWKDSINECFNVDSSPEMHDIADSLLKGGNKNNKSPVPFVFYRQFLPASNNTKFDIVVCSYTLFEFPNTELRLKTIINLWNKTNDFFIVVDNGNSEGFKMIDEVRDFILETENSAVHSERVHIFAPCAHESECPLEKISRKPCCTQAYYILPPISRRQSIEKESYSYIVFRKGPRPVNDKQWPRLIRPTHKLKGASLCQLCTKESKLLQLSISKKRHGRDFFYFAKSIKSGERLPIQFTVNYVNVENYEESSVDELNNENDIADHYDQENVPENENDSD